MTVHPTSYCKPILRVGSQGCAISELQKLLAHWNIYNKSEAVFTTQLENAVKTFQRRMFLKQDGIVGPLTWQALYTGAPINMPVLRKGSFGEQVKLLQSALQAGRRYLIVVDGTFGPMTDEAVRSFQSQKGLVVDGVVGSCTWRALSRMQQ